jgi:hypothetical protein
MSMATSHSLRGEDGMARMREAEQEAMNERMKEVERASKTLERAEMSLGLLTQPAWPHFIEWLDELRDAATTSLLHAKDMGDVRAFQAQANLIETIKQYGEIVKREAAEAASVAQEFGARA